MNILLIDNGPNIIHVTFLFISFYVHKNSAVNIRINGNREININSIIKK